MPEAQIIIELKSPVLLGSGEGHGSLIDTDIVFDCYGLPYFPARRLKGLLRESATEVLEMLSDHVEEFATISIDNVFGTGTKPARVAFYNAHLTGYSAASAWLKWAFVEFPALFTSETVLTTISEIRMQTAMDEHGIAADKSLRSSRVLRPGFTFEAEVNIDGEDRQACELLALASANLRHIGSKRNRGFGEVECSMWMDGQNISSSVIDTIKAGV